ncbi:cysteine-rich venom protein [Microcaecilia unicolor]|uniref:Cysteine-rich venom protein-like n=1 Tax=Microcaecilia unicolor TaxID=1415580 RepID=A0A6P7XN92_9AMPH|nr:cysteine-rich venom protein-like [Microcaecilia unicolor]
MAMLTLVLPLAVLLLPPSFGVYTEVPFESVSTDIPEVQQSIIDITNDFRRNVDPPAKNMQRMEWNEAIADQLKEWVQTCTFNHSTSSERIFNGSACGENLVMSPYPVSWETIQTIVYNESHFFDYGVGPVPANETVTHYTQLVWYSSFLMAAAVAYCPNSTTIYKYLYATRNWPRGNLSNKINKPYLSGTQCGDCTQYCNNGLCTNPCWHIDRAQGCEGYVSMCNSYNVVQANCPETCKCPPN